MYVVCGEALFDVFGDGDLGDNVRLLARPGGSPFNVAIGLARLGGRVALLGGLSQDMLGRRLRHVLARENVVLDYLVDKALRTTLSLVSLNDDGVPRYAFYGDDGADRMLLPSDLPELGSQVSGLHFGSYTLVVDPAASSFLTLARRESNRRLVSLDPNVRPTVEPDLHRWRDRVEVWRHLADVIKVSDEDLSLLYPDQSIEQIAGHWLSHHCQLVVVTRGGSGATAFTAQGRIDVDGRRIQVVDTVGAGDSFQAALLDCLPDHAALMAMLASEHALALMLDYAVTASALTCTRVGADPPTRTEIARARPSAVD